MRCLGRDFSSRGGSHTQILKQKHRQKSQRAKARQGLRLEDRKALVRGASQKSFEQRGM